MMHSDPPFDTRAHYMALMARKRLYGGIVLAIFVALMVSGFILTNDRNAGGFCTCTSCN